MVAQQAIERFLAAGLNSSAVGDEIGTASGTDRAALLACRLLRSDRVGAQSNQRQKGQSGSIRHTSFLA